MLLGTNGQPIQSENKVKTYNLYWIGLQRALLDNIAQGENELSKFAHSTKQTRKNLYTKGRGEGSLDTMRQILRVMKDFETGKLKVGVKQSPKQ